MSQVVLGRLPRELRELLIETATIAAAAAPLLQRVVETRDRAAIAELERLESEGDRIRHEVAALLRGSRLRSDDRGRLLALVEVLDDTLDALEEAAHRVSGCECDARVRTMTAVVRDAVRVEVRALREFLADAQTEAAREAAALEREGELIRRGALAEAAFATDGPLAAVRRRTCIDDVARPLDAALRAIAAIERMQVVSE